MSVIMSMVVGFLLVGFEAADDGFGSAVEQGGEDNGGFGYGVVVAEEGGGREGVPGSGVAVVDGFADGDVCLCLGVWRGRC
jgi:hypothetical protein